MSATSLHAGDVVVAVSQSGRTKALLDSMELVKKAGGIVIGLAPSNSPIARKANIAIEVNAKQDIQIYTPLSSRIAQLAVLDALAIGVAQKKGPQLEGCSLAWHHCAAIKNLIAARFFIRLYSLRLKPLFL